MFGVENYFLDPSKARPCFKKKWWKDQMSDAPFEEILDILHA